MTKSTFFFAFVLLASLSLSACKSTSEMQGEADAPMAGETPPAVTTMEAPPATGGVVYNEDAEALIAKHNEARGGVDKLKSIQSMKWDGSGTGMGMEIGLTLYFKRPGMVRTEVNVESMGMQIVQAYDGEKAWMTNPMTNEVQEMPGEAAGEMVDQSDFDGPLVDFTEKGNTITFEATEDRGDSKVHKLKITRDGRPDVIVYLDAETYMLVQTDSEGMNPQTGQPAEMSRVASDFREIEGVMFPHKMEILVDGQVFNTMTLETVELNVELEDKMFKMPGAKPDIN